MRVEFFENVGIENGGIVRGDVMGWMGCIGMLGCEGWVGSVFVEDGVDRWGR